MTHTWCIHESVPIPVRDLVPGSWSGDQGPAWPGGHDLVAGWPGASSRARILGLAWGLTVQCQRGVHKPGARESGRGHLSI